MAPRGAEDPEQQISHVWEDWPVCWRRGGGGGGVSARCRRPRQSTPPTHHDAAASDAKRSPGNGGGGRRHGRPAESSGADDAILSAAAGMDARERASKQAQAPATKYSWEINGKMPSEQSYTGKH